MKARKPTFNNVGSFRSVFDHLLVKTLVLLEDISIHCVMQGCKHMTCEKAVRDEFGELE